MNNLSDTYRKYINNIIQENKIVVFMKGDKLMPLCGFSNTVIQILNRFNINYHTVNVLDDENLRSAIKIYSQWPTIPQVYINGQFIGGSDVMIEIYNTNELKELLEQAINL